MRIWLDIPQESTDALQRVVAEFDDVPAEHVGITDRDVAEVVVPAVVAELRRVAVGVRLQYSDIMLAHRAAALDVADQLDALATKYELDSLD